MRRGQRPGEQMARNGRGQRPGQRPGEQREGENPGGKDGKSKSSKAGGKAAERTSLNQQGDYEPSLKDLTPQEKDAWGQINDREVARSLRGLWDKIPRSYRTLVTQYFRELSDPESAPPAGDEVPGSDKK